jgi:hypothetical protein
VRHHFVLGLLGLLAALFGAELEQDEVVLELAIELRDAVDLLFGVRALAQERLGLGRVVPEVGRAGAVVQLIELSTQGRDVKDAPLAS